jgi:radical SAM protein with 4Fe4S-binding SPASM domain
MVYSKTLHRHEFYKRFRTKSLLSCIEIEITERCNNACLHCYINQPQDDPLLATREMDTGLVKDVLLQAADLGCLTVKFTGGEPLLREDFVEIYLFARRLGLRVALLTNATLITEELCKIFKNSPPGHPLEVSVYGMNASSYDSVVSRTGAFNEFQKGINHLKKYDIPFIVKQSLLPQNRDEIPEFEKFSEALSAMQDKPGYSMNFDLRARRDSPNKNQMIKRLRYSPEETLAILTRDANQFVNDMRDFIKNHLAPISDELFSCEAGLGSVCVDAYGHVQMCMMLRDPNTVYALDRDRHNDLHSGTELSPLEYAISHLFPRIRQMHANNEEYLKRCGNCFLRGLCNQCPAKSWSEHGSLDRPVEYFCLITHEIGRYLGILKDGEKSWEVADWQERLDRFVNQQK